MRVRRSSGVAALLLLLAGGCSRQPEPYDVLLITLDTTRKSRLSVYGYGLQTSPNLEALAEEGVRFDSAFSQAAVTPVSHASILTGLNPFSHGLRVLHAPSAYRLPEPVPTLAEILRESGWRTAAFLSSFTVSSHFGLEQGFDHFDEGLEIPSEEVLKRRGNRTHWNVRGNQRRSDETTDRFLEWLEGVDGRYLAWIHYWDPHDENLVPPRSGVEEFLRQAGTESPRRDRRYDAEIFWVDVQIGRVLDALRETGRLETTIVVVTADHGEGLSDGLERHGWSKHRLLYQEQIDVPLILRFPEGPRGRVVESPVRSIDIVPTILDLLNVEPSSRFDGASLLPLVLDDGGETRMAYADQLNLYDSNAAMIRRNPRADVIHMATDGTWKLIYRAREPEDSELYNLDLDPLELQNLLASSPREAGRLIRFLRELDCFVDGPFPAVGQEEADEEVLERLRSLGYLE